MDVHSIHQPFSVRNSRQPLPVVPPPPASAYRVAVYGRLEAARHRSGRRPKQPASLGEAGLVALVALLSTVLYVGRIGFYSDDWFFIGALFQHAPDHSYLGLLWQFTDSNTLPRPVQLVYLTTLYYFFGDNPLGYHIVNRLSIAATGALFYLLLRELRLAVRMALAAGLLFVLLPHASASRYWYALFQANLSLLFF